MIVLSTTGKGKNRRIFASMIALNTRDTGKNRRTATVQAGDLRVHDRPE
jgi:hypothetical protein